MKIFFKQISIALTVMILTSIIQIKLHAAAYYASPDGTGTGTFASPCSFATGLSKLSAPGDTLYLRGGIYNLTAKVSINETGSSTARIAIMAYAGEKPILDFSGQPYGSSNPGISLDASSSYMHIKGLVIRYAGDNGIINNGNNHIIENCEFYGNCDTGLQHKTGGNNLILNCDSHHNFDYQSGGVTAANYGGNADGFADKQFTNNNPNTYKGCRAWNNSDDGWDFFERVGYNILENCICYNNGPSSYDMTNHPRYNTDKTWFDQFPRSVGNSDGGTITINLATYKNWGNGNGFKLGGEYTASNLALIRCLAVGNKARGFDQNNDYGTMTITNASAYLNGRNYGFGTSGGGTLIIKNSVSLSSSSADQFSAKNVTDENNSWNTPSITCNSSDFTSLDTTLILSPRNADGSISTTFMNLVPGSDLIDAGVFAGVPYAGTFPDMGYYETGTIDQFPGMVSEPVNKNQTVITGDAIGNIVFIWSGGATGVTVSGLPAGITQTIDNTAKTLTLSGITTDVANTYTYTVSTVGGTATPFVVTGAITVQSIVSPVNKNQTILKGNAITDIVFSWRGNDVTGLTVSGLPTGLNSTLDAGAKTLTISGASSDNIGNYTYTVSTVGGTGPAETATGIITIVNSFTFSSTKYYNIYSYGTENNGATTANLSMTKKYITADATTGKVVLVTGLSDTDETTSGTLDPIRTQANAQWIISEGTTEGYIIAKNRVTGTYLQVSATLSSSSVQFIPVYKKDDNGNQGYAISVSPTGNCIQIVVGSTVGSTSYADRVRMRWIFDESEDIIAGIKNSKVTNNFIKSNLVANDIELLNPEEFVSIEIINLNGINVLSTKVSSSFINVAALPSGFYLVKGINKNGEQYLAKIIKE